MPEDASDVSCPPNKFIKPRVLDQCSPSPVAPHGCGSSEFEGSLFRQMAQVRQKQFLKLREGKEVQESIRVSELQKAREPRSVRDQLLANSSLSKGTG